MLHYDTAPLALRDSETQKIYVVDESTTPIIRRKGMDAQLRPVFEITFIGREKNAQEEGS